MLFDKLIQIKPESKSVLQEGVASWFRFFVLVSIGFNLFLMVIIDRLRNKTR
jgi:hypothetical protein